MSKPRQQNLFKPEALPVEPAPWERAEQEDRLAAQVVFNRPLEVPFHYLVPDHLRESISPGHRVKAPFGRGDRLTVGFCVGLGKPPETKRSLKSIDAVIDREPLLSAKMLELTEWIATRYLCGWGQVLQTVVPAGVKNQAGTRLVSCYTPVPNVASPPTTVDLPPKQQAVFDALLAAGDPMTAEQLTEAADCGTGPINALRKKGLIQTVRRRMDSFVPETKPIQATDDIQLNHDQQNALDSIHSQLQSGEHRTILLHGVTGSGKTEVYIQAIREVVAFGRQAIVLVPEISLTPQTIRRFRSRFESVAVLHSHQSDSERHWHWQQIARGDVQVVVGARSAVFAPTPHLGLIVIDEEHETTFKQETTPRYHAREVARKRAELEQIPLVLGSATPTLESWWRAEEKKDLLLSMPSRVAKLPMPPVVVVDIRNDPFCSRGAAIGRALESAMRVALNEKGQIILFLNLRGYCPTLWCRACGKPVKCQQCDISLTWHRDRDIVLCHSCDFHSQPPKQCPVCGHPGMRFLGTGTQRLEQQVRTKFPEASVLRMDSDSMRRHGSHDTALESFRNGDVQILLGTQMIAKGLDFPRVTLVGVIDADTILHQPDLRAAERTFQLISQVAGRTGRSHRGGRVLVQTSSPTEPAIVMAAKHDYLGFAERELEHRRQMLSPPFQHFTRVILRGDDEAAVEQHAQLMATLLEETIEAEQLSIRVLGPAVAPIARLKGRYRYHFQLAASDLEALRLLWRVASEKMPKSSGVEFVVDVDPLNMR